MDDAFIKINTALLDSVSPPFTGNGNGRDQHKPKLASPPAWCSLCGESLIEFEFRDGFALTCDKVGCYLFRQTQVYRAKNPGHKEKAQYYRWSSSYGDYKAQKRDRYHQLRDAGIESRKANVLSSSNKQTQLALNMEDK